MSKITGNEPAIPIKYEDARIDFDGTNIRAIISNGLTIRQHFAAMAMQGLLSCGDHNQSDLQGLDERASIAAYSVQMADALIAELNKENVQHN